MANESWFDEAEPGQELNELVVKEIMAPIGVEEVGDYSETIAAAMEVVERMKATGYSAVFGTSRQLNRQWAEFFLLEDEEGEPVGAAYCCSTLEMAICLAALRARGYTGGST